MSEGVTVAVTDHAVERFRQRVGSRLGGFDVKPEIAGRVSEAWAAGRVSETPPPGAGETAARGTVYVRDLVDRGVDLRLPPRPRRRASCSSSRCGRTSASAGRASTSASPTR